MYREKGIFFAKRGVPPFDQVGYYSRLGDVPEKKAFGVPEKGICFLVGYYSWLGDVPGNGI